MLKRKNWLVALTALMMLVLVLSGCSGSKSPQDTLQGAIKKSSDIKSYSMKGSLKVADLKLPEAVTADPDSSMALGILQNAELSWTGAYRKDPMLMEINLQIAIKGDLAMTFSLPIIMNEQKMWIKVPNIPIFGQMGLPEDIVGKFIEIDMKKLAEQQGTEMPAMDIGQSQKLVNDLSAIVFKHIDEKTYLSKVSAKDAGIPDESKIKDVIQLHVTKDQVEPFIQTVVTKIAPEVIDLLSKNEEYRKMLQLKQEDLDKAKQELDKTKDEDLAKSMEDFKKDVKSLDIVVNTGVNGDGYASYSDATIKAEIDDNGQTGSGTLKVVSEMTDINGDVKLMGEPKPEEIVPMDQLNQLGLDSLGGSL
ncbi:hypothetical protein [Cohnella nanjingensis]|uniref:Lipoprotein n=1 Tax=Cohnella nanjingensis TaxID=1387779 RepID=A0A7X0RQ27_9BACL|nr:hypothetical protein [Cohnella nanjingensis]MBB6670189.1 hypothetical protein [Cohnella nanjingensis]